jgi:two-component system phosphate regulon sensor histidine kinase PhoR
VLVAAIAVTVGVAHGVVGAVSPRVSWLGDAGPGLQSVTVAVATALVAALVFLPLGVIVDRSLARLRSFIESAAESAPRTTYRGARWLRPVTRAFTNSIEQCHEREQTLRGQLRDLEIRHRVSEAERRQVEAVLNVLRDPVLVTDGFNEIVMANPAAAEALGFGLEDAQHKPIEQLVGDRRLCQIIADALEHGSTAECRHVEHEIKLEAAGEEAGMVYDVALSSFENHKAEVAGVVTVLHDLTRERELSQMKTDFVSKASHELRTPLSSIRAYVEMLVDGEAADEASRTEFYQIIQNETDRLGRLIDNMLNISRIEAGIVQIERENVDVRNLIDRAMSTIEPQAREKSITLNTRVSAVDLSLEGDSDMLYQVVLNLMSNAVKYTPEGGRVTVAADSDNLTRSVVVSVSDTGLGIPPDALPKLFEKFFRVDNYKRVAKGTGLGLSLCKHIVETVHRGQIGVESKLGMGSKFWFTIPMRYAGSRAA